MAESYHKSPSCKELVGAPDAILYTSAKLFILAKLLTVVLILDTAPATVFTFELIPATVVILELFPATELTLLILLATVLMLLPVPVDKASAIEPKS